MKTSDKKLISKNEKISKLVKTMTSVQRSSVRRALEKNGSFEAKKAKKLEHAIYQMCVSLSKKYEDDLPDIYGKFAFEKTGQLIQHREKVDDIVKDIANETLEWNSVVYAELRDQEGKDTTDHAAGIKVSKGEFICRNSRCKSDECYYYQSQERSADEGFSTRVVCTKCGHRYTFN